MKRFIRFFLFTLIFLIFNLNAQDSFLDNSLKSLKKVIMINPGGHAGQTGRSLRNGFERAATFQFAQELQGNLEKRNDYRVVLTRVPGEKIVEFQNASFANRLNVDLFIDLRLFKLDSNKPKVYIYYHVVDSVGDFVYRNFASLRFMPVLRAHQVNIFKTRQIAQDLADVLSGNENQKIFDFGGVFGIPLAPLCGIVAPALLIEVGGNQDSSWQAILEGIVQGIGRFL
jgi:N-acetylmuramoyl-L-alanine amidase